MPRILTDGNADDAVTGLSLIHEVGGDIASLTADAAYDTVAIYDAATARDAKVVVPPTRTAALSRRKPRSTARDRTITRVLGRCLTPYFGDPNSRPRPASVDDPAERR